MSSVQLPKRAAPNPTATEYEYRDWSEDESSEPVDDQVVCPDLFYFVHDVKLRQARDA